MIDRVAKEGLVGRRLFVGTTNLRTGRLKIWDLNDIARDSNPNRYRRYRNILLAATAIPVFFPPVDLDGELHCDGGARDELFLDVRLFPVKECYQEQCEVAERFGLMDPLAKEKWLSDHQGRVPVRPRKPRVFVIVNGKPAIAESKPPRGLVDIGSRAVSLLLNANLLGNLNRVEWAVKAAGMEFHMSRVPDRIADVGVLDKKFEQRAMNILYDRGVQWGRGAIPGDKWEDAVPGPSVSRQLERRH